MDGSDAPPVRDASGRFVAGNPGKRPGVRNRVSKRVVRAILRDFEAHQDVFLPKLRQWFTPQYVALVSRLLPRSADGGGGLEPEEIGEAELATMVAEMRAALDRIEAGGGSVEELEGLMYGERRHN